MALDSLHRWIERVAATAPVRAVLRRRYAKRFATLQHAFHGVFDSFAEAEAAAPSSKPSSYDNDASAKMYVGWHDVADHDYPALHWLHDWVRRRRCAVIADLGGSTGIKFRAFDPVLDLAPEVRWLVVEVPAVVALGRRLAQEEGIAHRLQFTASFEEASGCDVLLASGSLQYLPQSLPELLGGLDRLPARVIVNTTPVHPDRGFFTLNSIGTAVCPYRVSARGELVDQMRALGYDMRDSWRNLAKAMVLPFSPELSLQHYSGFCFDRVNGAS